MIVVAYVVAAIALFWLGMVTAVVLGGLGFIIVAVVLGGLKLAGIFPWSWWWAMLPLWAAVGGAYVKTRMAARDPRF
jgi:hypothetical protein